MRAAPRVLLLLVAGALVSACKGGGTYVVVAFEPGAGAPRGIQSIELDLAMAGRMSHATFTGNGGGEITLPTDATLEIGSGAGDLSITARARGAGGELLQDGTGHGTVTAGSTTRIVVQLGKPSGDGGAGDAGQPGDGGVGDGSDGGGPAPPQIAADKDRFDFGTVVTGNASGATVITVRNTGGQRTGTLTTGVVDAVTFPASADTCSGMALDPGASCTLSVKFQPATAGMKSTTLHVDATPGGTAGVALSGLGVDPGALSIAPLQQDLGSVQVGQAGTEMSFRVSNTGGAATSALMTALTGSNAADFRIGSDGCAQMTLQPGASCVIGVAFTPSATGSVGSKSATLAISATTGGTATAGLTGTALGPALLAIVPTDQDFGMVAQASASPEFGFTISNGGGLPSGTLTASIAPPGEFAITTNTCDNMALQPNATCRVGVKMTPAATGARAATLAVTGNPGGTARATLRGIGLAPGMLTLSPSPKDFGIVDVGSPSTAQFTVTNSGGSPTTALSVVLSGASELSLTNDACGGRVLAPGGMCTFSVVFMPTTFGARSGSVTVSAAPGGSAIATLSGIGRDYVILTVTRAGTGSGTIAATGLFCAGNTCMGSYPRTSASTFQSVDISASPDSLSTFSGWSGSNCSGTGVCSVVMDATKAVTATFAIKTVNITIRNVGLGTHAGTVVSGDGTINCSAPVCGPIAHPATTSFMLTALANGASTFAGWGGGACKGTRPNCTLPLTSDVTVMATFGPQSYMFVTSTTPVPGRLGGLGGADAECINRATAAGLPGTYRAWLSNVGVDANTRVGSGAWVRTDGRPFAPGIGALKNKLNQVVWYPPRVDENGNDLGPTAIEVATGGNNDGSNFGPQCSNYASTIGSLYVGTATAGSQYWSYNYLDSSGCATPMHLYCFRIDLAPTLAPPPVPGRRIFTSELAFTPGGGIAAADQQCRDDAQLAGLPNPGAFVALLATAGASAASRVDLTGPPWRRADNVLVVLDAADLGLGNLFAPIDLSADGTQYINYPTWTGASDVAVKASDGYACNDWTTAGAGAIAYYGYPNFAARPDWFNSGRIPCNTTYLHLICAEK